MPIEHIFTSSTCKYTENRRKSKNSTASEIYGIKFELNYDCDERIKHIAYHKHARDMLANGISSPNWHILLSTIFQCIEANRYFSRVDCNKNKKCCSRISKMKRAGEI